MLGIPVTFLGLVSRMTKQGILREDAKRLIKNSENFGDFQLNIRAHFEGLGLTEYDIASRIIRIIKSF